MNEGLNTWETDELEPACHSVEVFWCEESRIFDKITPGCTLSLTLKTSSTIKPYFFLLQGIMSVYLQLNCLNFSCFGKVFDDAERWVDDEHSDFPSASVKGGKWGHIEHQRSRNIKGQPGVVQWRAVSLQYAAPQLHTAAWQPEFTAGISVRLHVWQIQRACQVETVSEELLSY